MANFKTVYVKFKDSKYNYLTSVNKSVSDKDIKAYFLGTLLNLGTVADNMQKCIDCEIK